MNEYYKKFVNLFAILIVVLFETFSFAYVWYAIYVPPIEEVMHRHFFRRGNWAIIGLYTLITVLFTNTFDGYKITYLRLRDIILSHIPAVVLGAVSGYLIICLVSGSYFSAVPMLFLSVVPLLFLLL